MERLYNRTKTTNKDVFSDPSHRMSQRPAAVKSGEGLGFQDIGSSLGPPKPVVTYGKSSKGKFKPAAAFPAGSRKPPSYIPEDESDDELLLSSQNSVGGDATSSSKRVVKGKKPYTPSDDEETVRVNGRVLTVHPDYKPSSFRALKTLRFTKNKESPPAGDVVIEVLPPSSSLTDSQDLFKPISDDIEILDDCPASGPSSSRQRPSETSSTRPRSPSATRVAARRFTDTKESSTPKPSSPTVKDTARTPAKPRPRPRVVKKSAPRQRDSSPESTPYPAAQKRGLPPHSETPGLPADADSKPTIKKPSYPLPLHSKTPELSANADSKQTAKKPHIPSLPRREPQEFPMSLQAKENVSDGAWSGDVSPIKTKKAIISRAATFVHTPKPIPLPSPLGTKPISRGTTFPNLSPLSSSNDKGKARAKSPEEDDMDLTDGSGKRNGPKPFPMSSQILAGIDRRSKSPSTRSIKATKRASSDDSVTEQWHTAKKRKDSRSGCVSFIPPLSPAYLFTASSGWWTRSIICTNPWKTIPVSRRCSG